MNETLIVHVNAFTHKIEGGYTVNTNVLRAHMEGGHVPKGASFDAKGVGAFILAYPQAPVRFLNV